MNLAKRLSVLFVVGMLCLSTACGNNTGKTEEKKTTGKGGNTNTADTSAEEAYFDNVPSELEGTTVKFATWIDHTRNESAQVLTDFTDLTGINVKMVSIAQSDYISKLTSLIAAGESPDIVVNNGEWPKTLSLLTPLDETILDTKDTFWDQDIVNAYTVGGRPYLVNVKGGAWDMGGSVVVYNNRILEDNGITTPGTYVQEGRWTLDNFFKCAKELKSVTPDGGCGITISTFLSAYGPTFLNWDSASGTFKSNITDSKFISNYQKLVNAREAGYANVVDDGARFLFEQERMGLLLCGSYGLRKTGWFNGMDQDDIAFAPLPKADGNSEQVYGSSGSRAYGICKGSKNPSGSAYFLRYFLNMDHYDVDEVYKNEECYEMALEIQKNQICKVEPVDTILGLLAGGEKPIYKIFPDLSTCTASQVSTALNSGANTMNACIAKANEMVADVVAKNKK